MTQSKTYESLQMHERYLIMSLFEYCQLCSACDSTKGTRLELIRKCQIG